MIHVHITGMDTAVQREYNYPIARRVLPILLQVPRVQHWNEEPSGGGIWQCLHIATQEPIHVIFHQDNTLTYLAHIQELIPHTSHWYGDVWRALPLSLQSGVTPENDHREAKQVLQLCDSGRQDSHRDPACLHHVQTCRQNCIYQEDFHVWRANPSKTWPYFQANFIEAQADLREICKIVH